MTDWQPTKMRVRINIEPSEFLAKNVDYKFSRVNEEVTLTHIKDGNNRAVVLPITPKVEDLYWEIVTTPPPQVDGYEWSGRFFRFNLNGSSTIVAIVARRDISIGGTDIDCVAGLEGS